ncbi:MAG: cation transporter [Myxococcales bacterium]|nr:cation transporter [Myxococcales bacterium]
MPRLLQPISIHASLLAVSLAILGCQSAGPTTAGQPSATQVETREAIFHMEGMTCASCNVTVKVAAEKVPGVQSARADAETGRAWVTYDPVTTTPAQIAAAISETGYQATPIEESTTEKPAAPPPPPANVSQEAACKVLKQGVYGLWPDLGRAPRSHEIAKALAMNELDVVRALDALASDDLPCGHVERAHESDRIVFAWPLSNVPTEYIVKLEGKQPVYGRCAIDALGVSAMYGKPVEIEATSVGSGTPIRIRVNGDRIELAEPADAVVWVREQKCSCDEMVLFANKAELEGWRRRLEKPEGHTLTLADATMYGVRTFGDRLR